MGAIVELPGLKCWDEDKANGFVDARLEEAGRTKGMNGCAWLFLVVVGRLIPGAMALASARCCWIVACAARSVMGAVAELLGLRCWIEENAKGFVDIR
jgi:hypothetical protein